MFSKRLRCITTADCIIALTGHCNVHDNLKQNKKYRVICGENLLDTVNLFNNHYEIFYRHYSTTEETIQRA